MPLYATTSVKITTPPTKIATEVASNFDAVPLCCVRRKFAKPSCRIDNSRGLCKVRSMNVHEYILCRVYWFNMV